MFCCTAIHCSEAEVVLLYDRGVQRVEIEQQNNAIVEASFGFEHETTTVLGLLASRFTGLVFASCLFVSFFVFAEHCRTSLLCVELLFVRAQELTTTEFVQQ